MAKKLGRPKKKRKYTKRASKDAIIKNYLNRPASSNKDEQFKNKAVESLNEAMHQAKNGDTIFVNPPSNPEQPRASTLAYTFVQGCKVLVRNLSDEILNERYEQIHLAYEETRRQLDLYANLKVNMSMEQRFRGLK